MRCTEQSRAADVAIIAHRVCGSPLDTVRKRVLDGQVFGEIPIWTNEHEEAARTLRLLVEEFRAAAIAMEYFVLMEEQRMSRPEDAEDARASAEELLSMLEAHETTAAIRHGHEES